MGKQNSGETRPDAKAVQGRILALYDDLAEFQDQCSFLCDAFASIVTQVEVIDQETVRGVSIYSEWVKERVGQLKAELKLSFDEVALLATVGTADTTNEH